MKNTNEKLVFCSFWMTIAVVIYHTAPHLLEMSIELRVGYLRNFFDTLGPIALNYFFAVSAFKFFASSKGYKEKLLHRIRSLAVPFAVWNTLYILLDIIQNGIPNVRRIVLGYTLEPFDGPLWYIFVLFSFFVLLGHIQENILKITPWILVVTAVGASYFHWLIITEKCNFPFDYWIERAIRMIPPFLFGAYCGKFGTIFEDRSFVVPAALAVIGFLCTMTAAIALGDGLFTTLTLYAATICLWAAIPDVKLNKNSLLKRGVFLIYAMHDGMIRVGLALINRSETGNILCANIGFFLLTLMSMVGIIWIISLSICKLIDYCPKQVNHLLTGGRN